MRKSSLLGIILLSSLCTCNSGCSRTSGISGQMKNPGDPSLPTYDKQVVIENSRLASYITISDLRSVLIGGLIKANVTISSLAHDTLPLQYKFRWFDINGMEVSPDSTAWQPVILYGKDQKVVQGVAPNVGVKEFKILFRDREE